MEKKLAVVAVHLPLTLKARFDSLAHAEGTDASRLACELITRYVDEAYLKYQTLGSIFNGSQGTDGHQS